MATLWQNDARSYARNSEKDREREREGGEGELVLFPLSISGALLRSARDALNQRVDSKSQTLQNPFARPDETCRR